MKLIIPMAGKGTRLRPHTHVTPKPLMPIVGASMVERIVNTFSKVIPRPVEEAVFILGDFPPEVKRDLTEICSRHGITARFGYQEVAQGTAHAVFCAEPYLEGEGIVVFADTLFMMDPVEDLDADVVVWVKHVEDPSRFGVVVAREGRITALVEKPQEPISNDAIIGIYYVRQLAELRERIRDMIEHERKGVRGEYEITDAFDAMLRDGRVFKTASVNEWLDAGTIPALVETTRVILDHEQGAPREGEVEDSVIVEPVYLGPGARVVRSVVGPYVSVEAGARVTDAVVRNSILFSHAHVEGAVLDGALVGRHAEVHGRPLAVNVGDHSSV